MADEANVISFSAAAEQHDCARSTLYRAAERGELNTVEVGTVRMILKDEKWKSYEVQEKGRRVRTVGEQDTDYSKSQ